MYFLLLSLLILPSISQEIKMERQICIYLSQFYIQEHKQEVYKIILNFGDQQSQHDAQIKLNVLIIKACEENIDQNKALKALTDINSGKFAMKSHEYLFEQFDFQEYKISLDLRLNRAEKEIYESIQSMQNAQKNKQQSTDEDEGSTAQSRARQRRAERESRKRVSPSATQNDVSNMGISIPSISKELLIAGCVGYIYLVYFYVACLDTGDVSEFEKELIELEQYLKEKIASQNSLKEEEDLNEQEEEKEAQEIEQEEVPSSD